MDETPWPEDPHGHRRAALRVKRSADWRCDRCDRQCRRPGEPWSGQQFTLMIAHINHDPTDFCPANLAALCIPCHVRYLADGNFLRRKALNRLAAASAIGMPTIKDDDFPA